MTQSVEVPSIEAEMVVKLELHRLVANFGDLIFKWDHLNAKKKMES